jgi:hypothetical protein
MAIKYLTAKLASFFLIFSCAPFIFLESMVVQQAALNTSDVRAIQRHSLELI